MPSRPMRPTSSRFWTIAGNNGSEAIFEKVAVFDRFVGRFENSTKLQRHRLKVGLHQPMVGVRQARKNSYWDWKRGDWSAWLSPCRGKSALQTLSAVCAQGARCKRCDSVRFYSLKP